MKGKNNPGRGLSSRVRITNTIPSKRAETVLAGCKVESVKSSCTYLA